MFVISIQSWKPGVFLYENTFYPEVEDGYIAAVIKVMGTPVSRSMTANQLIGGETTSVPASFVFEADIIIESAWPHGRAGQATLLYERNKVSSGSDALTVGQRYFGLFKNSQDGQLFAPGDRYRSLPAPPDALSPGQLISFGSFPMIGGSSLKEVIFKNYFQGVSSLSVAHLQARLDSIPGSFHWNRPFRFSEDVGNASAHAVPNSEVPLDEGHEFLIQQTLGKDRLKQFLVTCRLVEWRVRGSQQMFIDAASRLAPSDSPEAYRDVHSLELRFDQKNTTWRPRTEQLLGALTGIRSVGAKAVVVRAISVLSSEQMRDLARFLVDPDIGLRVVIANKLAVHLKERERIVDNRLEGEEYERAVNAAAEYWMERFGIIER